MIDRDKPLKIALFGTSADPPTAAHQTILKWLAQHYDRVAVWASDNPFKGKQTPLAHRMIMLQLLIDDLTIPQKNIKIYAELSHLRSLISVEKAQEIWGTEAEYTLVIGSDLIEQIRHWYRVEELLRKVKLLVILRPGYTIAKEALEALQNLGGHYHIIDLNAPAISSSQYRQKHDKSSIIQPIKNYIYQEKLYSNSYTDRDKYE